MGFCGLNNIYAILQTSTSSFGAAIGHGELAAQRIDLFANRFYDQKPEMCVLLDHGADSLAWYE